MAGRRDRSVEAYLNKSFLNSRDARALRILSEYVEPETRFEHYRVDDTIVFMGSARVISRQQARSELRAAENGNGDITQAKLRLEMSHYYEAARELARRLTEWSKQLADEDRRFVVCTGGGPGVMEAANRGASEAKGVNVGLTISIPAEEFDNPHVTRQLSFHFHYFFMRKFWFAYLAKAVIVFPGGFGTLDELFELLTLLQTGKMRKHLPVVLFGKKYWSEVINFDALIKYQTISAEDPALFFETDSVGDAYEFVVSELSEYALEERGAIL
ncbi:MAG: LOG family protein [Acidiferrobacterales bacterium]